MPHPNPIDVAVGKRLREVRIMRNLTQTQLGDKLGISFQQVQKYEKGTNRIGSSRMWMMCRILDIDPNYLFEGVEDFNDVTSEENAKISRRALRLAKALDAMADEGLQAAVTNLLVHVGVDIRPVMS